ncbi:MAG TPA: IS110 family transposase [Hyphomicrobiaceae bacterium]|nr:IS110 family transposase [Hyphomicrobiaceae bacterium]
MADSLNHHWCVGIDLHKDTLTACVLCRCCGEHSFKKIPCKCRSQIVEFFANLPRPHTVAIETVGFYRWLWDLLEPIVQKLVLADATQARALAGRRLKTDREDSLNIAELLAAGRLPTCYAPPVEVRMLRDVARHRSSFSRQHAHLLCRAKSLMDANNRPGPARLQSDGLIRYLKAQSAKLPAPHVAMLWDCVDQLALTERQIDQAERTLRELVGRENFASAYQLLTSFPGVALVTAATVLAEIGDFRRFKDPKAIGRYAGLNPRVFASGGKQRIGHIAKTGSAHLRWILQQAAWTAIRTDEHVKRIYLRIAKRSGNKAAAVAIARKLLVWMWAAVIKGEPYRTGAAA